MRVRKIAGVASWTPQYAEMRNFVADLLGFAPYPVHSAETGNCWPHFLAPDGWMYEVVSIPSLLDR